MLQHVTQAAEVLDLGLVLIVVGRSDMWWVWEAGVFGEMGFEEDGVEESEGLN